ncbi:hypothetical protein ID866_6056 [Astraeus odoratus]|nr:hypothetical protein ID866_6056 [Astraeus odoratus]
MSSLDQKLSAALKSRDKRLTRRRLPEPQPTTAHPVLDFSSNDYLSLSESHRLRDAVLTALNSAPDILGSGGSRLLVPSPAHAALESRLCQFFDAPSALVFNSGFDANTGFFSSVPQPGDVVLYDEYIHASVHDGMRASRLSRDCLVPFAHNSVPSFQRALEGLLRHRDDLKAGKSSVFVAVESLYSMDGTFAPLVDIVESVEKMLPSGNGYIVVDEAHSTGIYGPKGRGLVAALGLEKRIFARLHTFGKALAASGAVLLTTELVRDYLLNYARSFIYTTALTNASIVAVGCSFDMLANGTAEVLSAHLLDLSTYFVSQLRPHLRQIPPSLLRLPDHLAEHSWGSTEPEQRPHPQEPWYPLTTQTSFDVYSTHKKLPETPGQGLKELSSSHPFPPPSPIIPLLTPEPRSLSNFLLSFSPSDKSCSENTSGCLRTPVVINTKPIFPPTVPAGTSRVRVCLHAGHSHENVDLLIEGIVAWSKTRKEDTCRRRREWEHMVSDMGMSSWMEARL